MASVEQTFKTAEKALTDAKNALDNRVQSYTYKGKKYSLTQLNSELIPQLKTEFENAKRQISIQTSVKWIAETTLDAREADAKYALSQFKEGKISESELRKADEDVSDAQTVLDKVNQGVPGEIVTSEETGKFVVSFIGEKPVTAGAGIMVLPLPREEPLKVL
jgi:HKD family nuclease